MEYITRLIEKELKENLEIMGAILIRGPKWCGKTTTASKYAKSILEMQNPEEMENNINLAKSKPSFLLEGEKPRLIDEWQLAPRLWNAVRYSVDKISLPGQYILTGSATPKEDEETKMLHPGTGRFAIIDMKPMSLFESRDSTGEISLKNLFEHKQEIGGQKSNLDYEKTAYLICRGGWPNAIGLDLDKGLKISKNYVKSLINSDISRIDGVSRNPELARLILKSYARQVSTIDSDKAIVDDINSNYSDVSKPTIYDYLNQLKKLFIIDEINAWCPNIRSKTTIRTSPKKSLVDPSIATAVLECTPKELMMDFNTYGLLFENLVDRDLSIYMNSIGGYINHYRDRYGLECDTILRLNNGKYALVETKLSQAHVDEAEKHLLKLKKLIEEKQPKLGSPEFMMIITTTSIAYTRESGVLIVPIGCLRN